MTERKTEPQHSGRRKHATAEFDTLEEVSHDLYQFFLLAPSSLRNELFAGLYVRRFSCPFVLWGEDADSALALENAMQPDLLFVSDIESVALEMKIAAECGLRQVLKYALLGLAVELHARQPRRHHLVLLGRGDFAGQWPEHFGSVTELKLALAHEDLDAFLSTQSDRFRVHERRLREIVASLDVAFLSYQELAAFLRDAAPAESDSSAGAEVYRKLIAGMVAELRGRGLAS